MKISKNRVYVSQRTLRRLCERALRVAQRHKGNATVDAASVILVPKVQLFMAKYDLRDSVRADREHAFAEGNARVATVVELARSRLPIFAAHLHRDIGAYVPESNVPDDLMPAIRRLIAEVRKLNAEAGSPLSAAFIDELEVQLKEADAKWTAARDLSAREQLLGQEVRDCAEQLQEALVMFRRVLASVLGRRSVDYQCLRYRTGSELEQDEATELEADAEAADKPAALDGEANDDASEAIDSAEVAAE